MSRVYPDRAIDYARAVKPQRFTATLHDQQLEVPFDVKAVYGSARAAVKMTVLGETHRTRVMSTVAARTCSVWVEALIDANQLGDGALLEIVLEADTEPRVVTPPAELAKALAKDAREGGLGGDELHTPASGRIDRRRAVQAAVAARAASRRRSRRCARRRRRRSRELEALCSDRDAAPSSPMW